MAFPPLYILRHGETEWNRAERLQGHLDSPLTERGRAQAREQREILSELLLPAGHVTVMSSPSPRALRTAEIALPGHPIAQDARLLEIDLGDWAGRVLSEIRADHPEIAAATDPHLWKFTAPRGERLAQMAARCQSLLASLHGPTVLVTHGITSRVLRCLALGLPPEDLSSMPGGQGVVHVVEHGKARLLGAASDAD